MGGEEVYLDGRPLSTIAAYGDLERSERFDGGCWEASWTMEVRDGWHHPSVRRGADVEIRVGGSSVFAGKMSEPDQDSWRITAQGLSREGERYTALDASGASARYVGEPTTVAVAKGLPWNYQPVGFPAHANPVFPVESDGINTISALWAAAADAAGWYWGVGPDRIPYAVPRPTTPVWMVAPGVVKLGVADDEYATHLVGRYLTTTATRATITRGDNGSAGTPSYRWGRSERTVDLTPRRGMSSETAAAILDGMLTKIGPRPGYTNGISLGLGEITTMGGTVAFLSLIRAGQMVRLHGVQDELTGLPYHDIVIGEIRHESESQTVYIEPLGLAARNLTAVLEGNTSTALAA